MRKNWKIFIKNLKIFSEILLFYNFFVRKNTFLQLFHKKKFLLATFLVCFCMKFKILEIKFKILATFGQPGKMLVITVQKFLRFVTSRGK